mgnify:CR=1 FL=1
MRKAGYHFNSDTLSFDKIESSLRKRLWRLFKKFFSSFSLAIVMLYLVYAFIDSPKEKLLKRKYEEVLTQYSLLSNKVEHLDNVLKDMESRDDNIYRVIFETDPIPSSIRRAGSGGVDQYEHLRQIDNADLIIGTAKKIDELSKETDPIKIEILEKEFNVLTIEERIAQGLEQFEGWKDVRLSVMDKIQNYYAPKLKAYYETL